MKTLFFSVCTVALMMFFTAATAVSEDKTTFTSQGMKITVETIASDLDDVIWSIEFLDSENLIFSEMSGKVKILNLKTKKIFPVSGVPESHVWGQGGLMDIHLHPDFKKSKVIYLSYTKKVDDAYTTAVTVAKLSGPLEKSKLTDAREIFVANNPNKNQQHFGSRFVHDEKGHLYFSVGDRGERKLAQDLSADQGKIHRLKLDGSIPPDNPFLKRKNARKSIWSYGVRNPQGMVYDFEKKILWEQEHGPRGGDEINIIKKGANYGWPVITYGREYYGPKIGDTKKAGMEQPVYHYTPSIAPSGLEIYRGKAFPKWQGDLFSGALKLTHINRLDMSSNQKAIREERLVENLEERIRDVKMGPDDFIYFSTDSGKILRLKPVK